MQDRSMIQSGDMLVWSGSEYNSKSDFYLKMIRLFTRSEFAHTATAWRVNGHLMVVEATQPVVRLSPVRDWDSFYCIPMNVQWTSASELYMVQRIGSVYSFMDAYRAYVGKTVEDDARYQCAELCHEFYKLHGIDLGETLTPSAIVKQALKINKTTLSYAKPLRPRV